jgi:hypothetical protein
MYSSPVAIHVRITRYSRWYAELARDAYVQGYNERFAPFSTHNASLSPTDLLMEVATSADTFLAFVQLDTEGLVCVFHRIRCIETFLGGPQDSRQVRIPFLPLCSWIPRGLFACSIAFVAWKLS